MNICPRPPELHHNMRTLRVHKDSFWEYETNGGSIYRIGAQILGGVGAGIGGEQGNVAVQNILPSHMIESGTSLALFTRLLGFAVAVPIAQSALQLTLANRLGADVAAQVFGEGGATDIRVNLQNIFGGTDTPEFQAAVLDVNTALTRAFLVCLILGALSFPFTLLVEWKSVKAPKPAADEETADKDATQDGIGMEKAS